MMFVKLSETKSGSIKAETYRKTLGYFDDMTVAEVAAYLVERAEAVGEAVRFVDDLDEPEEVINVERIMIKNRKTTIRDPQ